MKKRDSWLLNNNFVRFLSVIMGFALWVIVNSSALNSSSGVLTTTQTIRSVPVEVLTSPHMLAIDEHPRQVNVNIYGSLIEVTLVQAQSSGIRVIANAVNLGPGVHRVPLTVEGGPTSAVTYAPQTTTAVVDIEQKVTATYRPHVTVIGEPGAGLRAGAPILSSSQVNVAGPDALVHQVTGVEVRIDVGGSNNSVSRVVPVIPVGRNGRIISGVTCTPATETLTIPIHNPLQPYTLVATTTGLPQAPYVVSGVSIDPNVVGVSGSSVTHNHRPTIVLPPVDVTNWNSTRTVQVSIPIPFSGGRLSRPFARVTVQLVPGSSTNFTGLPVDLIGEKKKVTYAIVGSQTANVAVTGPTQLVANLVPQDVQPYVDVSSLQPGQKLSLPVGVALPNMCSLQSVTPGFITVVARAGK